MSLGEATVTIKKVKKVMAAGHHGGAWKVAYADFVTAMMAFFLLMWLSNTVSPEQKKGLADYFAPASVSETTSGSGGNLAGTALGDDDVKGAGSLSIIEKLAPESPNPTDDGRSDTASLASASDEQIRREAQRRQEQDFMQAAESIKQALKQKPELAELSKQVMMTINDEGLLIQLVDPDGGSMFNRGSATPTAKAQILLQSAAQTIKRLPNRVKITGHTSIGSTGKTEDSDYVLSFQRAQAAQRILRGAGVDADKLNDLDAAANSRPLYPDDPKLAGNQRIEILLLRERPVLPPMR